MRIWFCSVSLRYTNSHMYIISVKGISVKGVLLLLYFAAFFRCAVCATVPHGMDDISGCIEKRVILRLSHAVKSNVGR